VTEVEELEGRLEELRIRHRAVVDSDRVEAKITEKEMDSVRAELARAREEVDDLLIKSKAHGILVVPQAQDLPGRFIRKGELIGYTLDPARTSARIIVSQHDIDLVRQRTKHIEIRLAGDVGAVLTAKIRSETPAATDELPSMVLAQQGGGEIATDPRQSDRPKAFQKFFVLDLDFPSVTDQVNIGGRVYVRFDHGYGSLASQWYRSLRQLFLSRFNV
jgi:putative peptide zinc metalloprotease protein